VDGVTALSRDQLDRPIELLNALLRRKRVKIEALTAGMSPDVRATYLALQEEDEAALAIVVAEAREAANLRAALGEIAASYPWEPYTEGEWVVSVRYEGPWPPPEEERHPTNRKIARAALAAARETATRETT
jgi:hypothetical protein